MPVTQERPVLWQPNSAPQSRFLETGAYEALYGGAAGGGKSDALLLGALRYAHLAHYRALLLRRTFPELQQTLIDRSRQLYPQAAPGAKYNSAEKSWRFPSGAICYFGHAQHDDDVLQYQGAEFQYLGFDELTHFTEKQYRYLLSRARTSVTPGREVIPIRIRAATNPGGPGHEWVLARWAPWLNRAPEYQGLRAASGEVLAYTLAEDGTETWVPKGTPKAFGRVFVGAKATDNPNLSPEYVLALRGQDAVTRAQLLDGDWMARPAAGAYFKRGWWKFADAPPAEALARWRAWDRAATAPHEANKDPDWTRGVKISRTAGGIFFIENMVSARESPLYVRRLMRNTAELDGVATSIALFRDPGSAGKDEEASSIELLAGFDVHSQPATGDKVSRARPFSAQVEAGNVYLVRGPWNEAFMEEHEAFPDGAHDDVVDAASNGFARVAPASDLEFFNQMSSW